MLGCAGWGAVFPAPSGVRSAAVRGGRGSQACGAAHAPADPTPARKVSPDPSGRGTGSAWSLACGGCGESTANGAGAGVPGHWHLLSGLAQAEGRTGLWTQTALRGGSPASQRTTAGAPCPQHSRCPGGAELTPVSSFKPGNAPEGGACLPPRDGGSQFSSGWDAKPELAQVGGWVAGASQQGGIFRGPRRSGRSRGFGGL